MPAVRERDDARRFEAGQQRLQLHELVRGRVHHHVLPAARGDDGADHRVDAGQLAGALDEGRGVRDEQRLGREDVADRPKPVHHEGRAGRDEVDDGFREAEPWSDLDRARDRDHVDGDALLGEVASRGVRVGGRDTQTGEVGDRLVGRVRRDSGCEPAVAVPELADLRQLRAGLGEQVHAGDAEVGDAIADELDDIVGAHEEDVEREVLDTRDEAAVVLLEDQARVVEERQRRLDEAALVGDGEPQPVPHRSMPSG